MYISLSQIFKISQQGTLGDCWPDLHFTPSDPKMISCHSGPFAVSPDDPPDSWPGRESTTYAGGDEREGDSSDRKQKKKKKRRQKEEGHNDQGHFEVKSQGENTPMTEDYYHRIGPRRDRVDVVWEEQLGKSGGRGKRGKSRKKIPEEWGTVAEMFVPASSATSHITEEVMMELGSSIQGSIADSDSSQSPWKKEEYPEEGPVPNPLSKDLFSVASISPLVLKSELNATAAPFTMPSTTNSATLGSMPMTSFCDDSFDLLMDNQKANLDHCSQALSLPFSPENEVAVGDTVDSGMFDNTSSLQESSSVDGMPEEDTSAFSPASQSSQGHSPQSEVVASAPPLSPSDASWLPNDSQISSNSEAFDFSDMIAPGHPLPIGLSFDTPSPAPLRSPKTTAQEIHPKDAKKQPRRSHSSSSSSSSVIISTSSGEKFPPQASPDISPPTLSSVCPLAVPAYGLNPSAKPFYPSFANSMEEATVMSPVNPTIEGWLQSSLDKKLDVAEKVSLHASYFHSA